MTLFFFFFQEELVKVLGHQGNSPAYLNTVTAVWLQRDVDLISRQHVALKISRRRTEYCCFHEDKNTGDKRPICW